MIQISLTSGFTSLVRRWPRNIPTQILSWTPWAQSFNGKLTVRENTYAFVFKAKPKILSAAFQYEEVEDSANASSYTVLYFRDISKQQHIW